MRHEIIPSLRYVDAPRAIDFLCDAFGFQRHAVHLDPDEPSLVQHAQLVWHDRMIMLGSTRTPAVKPDLPPDAPGLAGIYLTVADVDAHAAHARAAGAEIILGPERKEGLLFLKKKKQKNFCSVGRDGRERRGLTK